MNIVVCAKQTLDPRVPTAKFRVDPEANRVVPPEGIPPVMSTFDEYAVEAALRIKEKSGGKITVITIGPSSARDVLKHAVAMGADDGILLQDPAFEGSDSFAVGYILSMAIQKIGGIDLIFCGRQAADLDGAIAGSVIAEHLGIPVVTVARKVEVKDGKVRIERNMPDGYEVLEAPMPLVVTIGDEMGLPRLPTGMGIVTATRRQFQVWSAQDIGVDTSRVGAGSSRNRVVRLYIPSREVKGEMIPGDAPVDKAVNLAKRLRASGLI